MPRTETTHRCSICHKGYGLLEQAEACEMKGEPDASKFPVGLIYESLRAGTDDKDGGGVLIAIKVAKQNGHMMELECYSAADVEDGLIDSVNGLSPMDTFDGTCFTYFEGKRTLSPNTAVRRGTLRLARMVQHLRSEGIEPLIWDGVQARRAEGTPYEMGAAFAAGKGRTNPFAPGSADHESFERGYRSNRGL